MGAPKGSSRLLQRIGRANHRLDEPSKGMIVPGNRFEYLEARAALDAVDARELDPEIFRPGTLDVLAQHILGVACAGPFDEAELLAEVRSAAPYAGLTDDGVAPRARISSPPAAMRLRAYDKFRRLVEDEPGRWRITQPGGRRPAPPQRRDHRRQSDDGRPLQERPHARQGRGRLRLDPDRRRPLLLRRARASRSTRIKDTDIIVHASSKSARIVTYGGQRMSMSTHLAERVRDFLARPHEWHRFPDDVREWLEVQQRRSILPQPDELLVETFPHEGRHYMVHLQLRRLERAPVARHADHQADGDRRASSRSGFVANDYALAVYGLEPVDRSRAAALARHPRTGIRRMGRAVAICSSAPSARSR